MQLTKPRQWRVFLRSSSPRPRMKSYVTGTGKGATSLPLAEMGNLANNVIFLGLFSQNFKNSRECFDNKKTLFNVISDIQIFRFSYVGREGCSVTNWLSSFAFWLIFLNKMF